MGKRKKRKINPEAMKKLLLPTAVFVILISIWEVGVKLAHTPSYILPAPSAVITAFCADFSILWNNAELTLLETVLGLVLAVFLGIVLAILMDAFGLFKNAVYPLMVVSQTIPVIVLAPLFIIYLGFGISPKILTVVLMCFFPIAVSFADGMSQIDPNQINLARAFGASRVQVYTIVKIPAAASSLFSGLKVAATYSITGAVVGEWLAANRGLGYYMLRVKKGYQLDKVFSCILMIIFLSLLMNGLVRLLHYLALPYLRQKKNRLCVRRRTESKESEK